MRVAGSSSCARAVCLGILCALVSSVEMAAADDYLEILEALASEGPDVALARWMAVSPPGATDVGVDAWEAQRRHRLRAATGLASLADEVLLPVIDLHDRLQLEYRAAGDEMAAQRERVMVYQLTDLYAARASAAASRALAGDLLALVAADFDRQPSGLMQTGLYRRALDLEVRNPTALAGLAWSFESSGQHRRSLAYLELLFAFVPRDEEVRLRRAVNLYRVGRRGEALQILHRLAETAETGWIGALAYQQWARALLDAEDFRAAREVLRRGRRSHPLESALATAEAYVEERLNQTAVAGNADLAVMASWPAGTVASRFAYATFASPWIEDARLRLRQAAAQASRSLARALKQTTAEADR